MIQQFYLKVFIQRKQRHLKDTCTPTFTVALFIVAEMWKQPNYPLMDKCIKQVRCVCVHKTEYYSAIKNNEILTDVRPKPTQHYKAIILQLKVNKSKRISAFVQNQQACYCKQLWCIFNTSNAYNKHVALCLNLKKEQNLAICGQHVWTLRTVCSVK